MSSDELDYYPTNGKTHWKYCGQWFLLFTTLLVISALCVIVLKPLEQEVDVSVITSHNTQTHTVNTKFLSLGLDSALIADGFKKFNFSSPRLLKLIKPLAPAYLRIGGTMADRLIFSPNGNSIKASRGVLDAGECSYEDIICIDSDLSNFTMSGKDWLDLNALATKAGLTIIFDLNSLIRYENGSWNSTNAETLINFSSNHNLNLLWELGNEPNAFRHVFNYEVNASQLAKDFRKLRKILQTAVLVGPDVTRPRPHHKESEKYLREFLQDAGDVVDAITWHQYYVNGRTATESQFLSPKVFDLLIKQIETVKKIVAEVGRESKAIWLGETSSAYGGGAPGLSNRYVGIFIWIDKLGVAAKYGLDVVVRQSLFRGYYALITDDYQPTPDWWISVIYKRLVGSTVIPCNITSSQYVRLYCHCTESKNFFNTSLPIVFGLNMKSTEAKVNINQILDMDKTTPRKVYAYTITPCDSLISSCIQLNSKPLKLLSNGDIPPLIPKEVKGKPYLIMPPYSVVFWVINEDGNIYS